MAGILPRDAKRDTIFLIWVT